MKSLCLALVAASLAASAASAQDQQSVRVRFEDLNLNTRAGVAALERRLSNAADAVCDVSRARDLAGRSLEQRCRAEALAAARAQMVNRTETLAQARGDANGSSR